MIQITLQQIKDCDPCESGWLKILAAQGPDMDKPFPLLAALDSNGLYDTLWAFRCLPEHANLWRKYSVWCARQVQHLMTDARSINALNVASLYCDGLATIEDACSASASASAASAYAYASVYAFASASASASAAARKDAKEKQEAKLKQILDAGEWVE